MFVHSTASQKVEGHCMTSIGHQYACSLMPTAHVQQRMWSLIMRMQYAVKMSPRNTVQVTNVRLLRSRSLVFDKKTADLLFTMTVKSFSNFILCQNCMMFLLVLYPPILRLNIAYFAVAEGWLLLDIGWFVLFSKSVLNENLLSDP